MKTIQQSQWKHFQTNIYQKIKHFYEKKPKKCYVYFCS